ncbi:MAG: pirin family protein, partial [Acidobacteria bacterium]|nr:pirin family protein [Acidobacteriota bacterium]
VQWLTTGSGIMHAEMFPLIHEDRANPLELFQIWLNLPPESKMVDAYFGMLWCEEIPTITPAPGVSVDVIAGPIDGHSPPAAPPDSWASQPGSHLAIWLIRLDNGASWTLPTAPAAVNRMLHCFIGDDVRVGGLPISDRIGARLAGDVPTVISNHGAPAEFLLLQGMPIGAPVFQMGPFVMNSHEELRQAVIDYNRTQFGGWPWDRPDPVHARTEGRFALHADGRVEHREMQSTA